MVQRIRIHQQMQGIDIADPGISAFCGDTKPVATTKALKPVLHKKRSHQNEKPMHLNEE